MRSVRFSTFACLASLSGACSDPTFGEAVQTKGSAIIEGLPSTAEEDFVVHIRVAGVGICTGTMIAPNTVLTALHCVSEIDPIKTYYCNDDGTVTSGSPGGGVFEGTVEPARVEIRVGPAPGLDDPAAYGERVFGSGSPTICMDDIAVVVLDRNLELPPQRVRLGEPTIRGTYETVIGYGQTEDASAGLRHRRSDVRVLGVGEFGSYRAQGLGIVPHTLVLDVAPCHGDSGGPTFDQETFAVVGVSSLLSADDCEASDENVFTQVGAFETLIREALDYAGFDPLVEPDGDGAGGEGGTGSTDPGSGGEPQGGASTDPGGAPGTGGSGVSTAGRDTGEGGEGGEGATSPAAGGTGATAGSTGQAGSSASTAGNAEVPGVGSGSRNDGSCACRLEDTRSNRGLGWAAFLSLLAAAVLRRRAR